MLSVVGTRYARALAEVVLAPGSGLNPETVSEQLKLTEDLIESSGDLKHVMLSPAIARSKKRAVMAQLAAGLGLERKVLNFLYVVIDHRRVHQLSEIRQAFQAAVDETVGVVRAQITSAQPLNEPQRRSLEAEFAKATGKQMRVEYGVDESLIGGVTARLGSTVYDGSVKGQLEELRRKLVAEA